MDFAERRSSVEHGLLQVSTPSFALTFANKDRVIYVYARMGFYQGTPVIYFDVRNYLATERNLRKKKDIDDKALLQAVFMKGAESFKKFYILTEEEQDYVVMAVGEEIGVQIGHQTVCLPLEDRIVPMEDYFEYDDSLSV